ncbi:MAG: hypothetical protein P9L91_08645, partial [Candidatus Zophobacter franzmannii]|nr:hypothetical protein [Candidatus Zophobacter franzmannii]
MNQVVCSKCHKVHGQCPDGKCPEHPKYSYDFKNSDDFLKREVERVTKERIDSGLEGIVGNLEAIIINVEPDRLINATQEFLDYTGYDVEDAFQDEEFNTIILREPASAKLIIRSRKQDVNPFRCFNLNPKSEDLPNTRLETFVFATSDINKYYHIQSSKGTEFLSESVLEFSDHYFLQTAPSKFTGISVGVVEWKGENRCFRPVDAQTLVHNLVKPEREYLKNIGFLDHTASRVRAAERDNAIIEFMELTNYRFEFAIYVESFNSITSVARLTDHGFAMVFTSGIVPFKTIDDSGPTEKFIYNYGTRTHHLAFVTENIESTYENLGKDGMEYLVELVGAPEQGLKQTFTVASENTLLVNEYIHRYGNFMGFFTRENVTALTASTEKQ